MPESSSDSRSTWGLLGIVGALSFCCVGTSTLAGGAAIAGSSAAGATAASGGSLGGMLVTGLATALPLFVAGVVLRWRTNQ